MQSSIRSALAGVLTAALFAPAGAHAADAFVTGKTVASLGVFPTNRVFLVNIAGGWDFTALGLSCTSINAGIPEIATEPRREEMIALLMTAKATGGTVRIDVTDDYHPGQVNMCSIKRVHWE